MKIKRIIAVVLTIIMLSATGSALALEEGDARVVLGADNTVEQINTVYSNLGIERGTVTELYLTNTEEHAYLDGFVPTEYIGTIALSCVYVKIGAPGSGIHVTTSNITWCTAEMYKNALVTAGIEDAQIIVTAARPVSGTAGLGGIYKAYEDISGRSIDEDAKQVGTQELVVTAELAEEIGNYDAVAIVNELKKILEMTKDMTDDEVRNEIRRIAAEYNIAITEGQVEQLLSLCRSLEGLDSEELQRRVESVQTAVTGMARAQETVSNIATGISNFFRAVGDFFSNLFGGGGN